MTVKDDDTGGYRAQTLTRGLTVLRTIADARRPITLQDLYDRTEIPKPTLVRLLAILTKEGCTLRLDDRPTYGLGPTISAIAAGVSEDLQPEELARPYLQELAASLGHTANLGVISGNQVLHVCVVLADRPIRYIAHTGTRDDTYCTGLGKALLSQMTSEQLTDALTGVDLVARTANSITSRSKLDAELRRIRRNGYAYDDQEGAIGLSCFAIPVTVDGRCVAALSVSGPAGELPESANERIVGRLQAVAEQIAGDDRLARALLTISPA